MFRLSLFCYKFGACWFWLRPIFCVRPVKQGGGKMCKPTKNQFLYSSWDLGREIDPAFAIVAASGLYTSQQV